MCRPGPFVADYLFHTNDRLQLQAALDRLERLKDEPWCNDALLVLAAARKHLETLPKPAIKVRVTATRGERARRRDFDTRSDAVAWVTLHLWAYDSFSITEVEGC